MRLIGILLFACTLAGPALFAGAPAAIAPAAATTSPAQLLLKAPIRFEPNQGQFGGSSEKQLGSANSPRRANSKESVLWAAQGLGYAIGFTRDATLYRQGSHAIAMRLEGQNSAAPFEGASPLSSPSNYFTPAYRGTVPNYSRLRRRQVYPGIDLVYYGNGNQLEYDFEIAAGADPSRIRMHFDGAGRLRLSGNGDLLIGDSAPGSDGPVLTQHVPVVYQKKTTGERVTVSAAYRIVGRRDVTISLARYDAATPLVIDPTITFEAYLWGSGGDSSVAVAHDAQGFLYVAGNTQSTDFNLYITSGYQTGLLGTQNTWLMKLNPSPSAANFVVYSSFYGGSLIDTLTAMTIDANGLMYLGGYTTSVDIPIVNGYQTANAGAADGFVAAFDPSQTGTASLLYSTYLGGLNADQIYGITAINRKVYATGTTASTNFPVVNPFLSGLNGGSDVFLSEIDTTQSGAASLIDSTYLGGSGAEFGRAVAVDATGNVYVAGVTYSTDFPVSPTPYQAAAPGGGDIFLTKFDPTLQFGLYSTYLGGSGEDQANKIVLDPQGRVALTGYTTSVDFPITQNAVQPFLGGPGAANAFLTILDPTAAPPQAVVYSTYFGGSIAEVASDLRLDANGVYYFGGYSMSPDMPVTLNAINPIAGQAGLNGFLAAINPSLTPFNSLRYASFVTGSGSQSVTGVDIDASGSIYVTGWARGDIFPPGYQTHPTAAGNSDGFVWIFTPDPLPAQ